MSCSRRCAASSLLVVLLLLLAPALTGCGGSGGDAPKPPDQAKVVPASEAAAKVKEGYTLLDVRTDAEVAAGHLTGARHVDAESATFADDVAKLPQDGRYVVYCHSGKRAAQAINTMKRLGFATLVNGGGFDDLKAAGLPAQTGPIATR